MFVMYFENMYLCVFFQDMGITVEAIFVFYCFVGAIIFIVMSILAGAALRSTNSQVEDRKKHFQIYLGQCWELSKSNLHHDVLLFFKWTVDSLHDNCGSWKENFKEMFAKLQQSCNMALGRLLTKSIINMFFFFLSLGHSYDVYHTDWNACWIITSRRRLEVWHADKDTKIFLFQGITGFLNIHFHQHVVVTVYNAIQIWL